MHHFERSVVLRAAINEVFAFHADPHNISKISPAFLQIRKVEAEIAIPGDSFTLHLRIFGIPLNWQGKWETVVSPTLLVDTASVFPFSHWHHEHRFEAVPEGTRMTDCVSYALPGGWLGQLLGATVFRIQVILMFAGRHRATAAYFSGTN